MLKKYFVVAFILSVFAASSFAQDQQQQKLEPPMMKSEDSIPCKIIRQVRYPVTQTEPYKQPLRIALLNLCPQNPGAEARPMMSFMIDGEMIMKEYVVEKVFKNGKEAKKYANKNKITDTKFE
jgi:hypothetical protein